MPKYISNIPGNTPVSIEGYREFENYYSSCEMQTKEWLISNLREDSTFIDIGANVGILTLTAGKVIGSQGLIIAIEPTSTFKLLKENIQRRENQHTSPTTLINKAVGQQTGMAKESIFKIWGQKPEYGVWEFVTLDDLVKNLDCKRVDVIKIDTDGFELEVLLGAEKVINQFNPIVIVEINEALQTRGASADQIFDFFLNHRYTEVLLIDDNNYIFINKWAYGDPWPNSLKLKRWRKNSSIALAKGLEISRDFTIKKSNEAVTVESKSNMICKGHLEKWNYILDLNYDNSKIFSPVILEVEGYLLEGNLSIAIIDKDYQTLLSNEPKTNQKGPFKLRAISEKWEGKAVIRTISSNQFQFELLSVCLFEGVSEKNNNKLLSSEKWNQKIQYIENKNDFIKLLKKQNEDITIEDNLLDEHEGWLMEQSSSALLIEICNAIKVDRVLEIGTWEGFTASLLLKHTSANIWTMDSDEFIDTKIYPSRYQTLKNENIRPVGWLYKELNYENRVNQIFANSQEFDYETFLDSYFDVVFIDGDHSELAVSNDTNNIISKLRIEGICIWDDFNFTGRYLTDAELGVTSFIQNNIDWISQKFRLFYVKGTQFLIGIKN